MMLEVRDQLNYDRGVLVGRREGLAEGLEQGKAEGLAAGREQGKVEGLAQGESRFALLLEALLADGRDDDVERIATDSALRSELYRSYGIA